MAHNKEYRPGERREYSAPNSDRRGQETWSSRYNDPQVLSWQRGYQQDYHEPRREYGSVCDTTYHSNAILEQSGFTVDFANQSSFHNLGEEQLVKCPGVQDSTSQVHYASPLQVNPAISRMHQHHQTAVAQPAHVPSQPQPAHVQPVPHPQPVQSLPHPPLTSVTLHPPPAPERLVVGEASTHTKNVITPESISISKYTGSFLAEVQKFVVEHKEAFDLLVEGHKGREEEIHHNVHSSEMNEYGQPEALEYYMDIDPRLQQSRFLQLVSAGDIVQGHVIDKSLRELIIQVTSFIGSHKFRELSDIGIKGLVPINNLADSAEKCNDVFSEMEVDDVVQGMVTHQKDNGCVELSFRGDHVEQLCLDGQLPSGVRLGYIEGKRPATRRSSTPKPDDYLCQLEEDPGFLNPSSNNNLKLVLGIHSSSSTLPLGPGRRPTLMKDFQKEEFADSDYCHALRKAQRRKWSMDTVAIGVKHFKAGENSKAMKYFDHALEIDATNVEGLVARGALFANDGKYKEGIADFEKALTLKHTHRNARNYLVQTQVVYGERLEREGKLEAAAACYREALADDPEQEAARTRLNIIVTALEKQAAEKRELERKKSEEKATLKKLQKLIEKEQERKKKSRSKKSSRKKDDKAKVYKKRKKKKVSSRNKTKKEHYHRRRSSSEEYSSDESTYSASSDRSRSRSPPIATTSLSRPKKRWSSQSRSRSRSRSPRSRTKRSRRSGSRSSEYKSLGTKPSSSRRSLSRSRSQKSTSCSPINVNKHKHSKELSP